MGLLLFSIDPIMAEAILRTVRTLAFITGALVLIDSVGILISPSEAPPHKPKWSAISWCITTLSTCVVAAHLLTNRIGLVDSNNQQWVWILWAGLATGFTCRAVSRAHRPFYTVLAVLGLSIAGVIFALKDIAG